jgi:predicted nucleotidyltransferase
MFAVAETMEVDSRGPDPALLRALRERARATIAADVQRERAASEALQARVLPEVRRGVDEARGEGLCRRAWLFGSFAWGLPADRSDVDLLVEGCPDPFLLAAVVSRRCGRDVHAVELERAPESLRSRVLADGTPL